MADQSRPWKKRILRGLGYLLVAVAAYLIALWQLLPYAEVGRRVEADLRSRGVGLEIQGLGPGSFLGCSADSVDLFSPDLPDLRWQLTDVDLHLLPQHLLTGERAAELQADTLGGVLETTALWRNPPFLDANWHDLQLSKVPLPAAIQELPLAGQTSGSLRTTVDPTNLTRADGTLEAQLQGVRIGAGKVQGIPVPELQLGDGTLSIRIAEGKVEVSAAEFKNGDLEISFTGSVLLREDLPRSLVNGILTLRPSEQAAKDLALAFALFPGAKGSDGRYTARVRGSLGAPRLLKR